jgi:hypothetical protein
MTSMDEGTDLRAAGAAALLELMDAAREWYGQVAEEMADSGVVPLPEEARLSAVVERLDILLSELQPEPAHEWRKVTWGAIAPWGEGTRVRLGGVEAVVETISSLTWHVDPNSPVRAPRPLERTLVSVKLMGRDPTYQFPSGNFVEVCDVSWPRVTEEDWAAAALAAQEQRAIQLLGKAFGAEKAS